jgi:hypothetical protein
MDVFWRLFIVMPDKAKLILLDWKLKDQAEHIEVIHLFVNVLHRLLIVLFSFMYVLNLVNVLKKKKGKEKKRKS